MSRLQLSALARRSLTGTPLVLLVLVVLGLAPARAEAQTLRPGAEVMLWKDGRALRLNDGLRVDTSPLADPAQLPAAWMWERFVVVAGSPGNLGLYSQAHDAFIVVDPASGALLGARSVDLRVSPPASFRAVDAGAGVALWSVATRRFVASTDRVQTIASPTPTIPTGQEGAVTFRVHELRPPLASTAAELAAAATAARGLPGFAAIADRLGTSIATDNAYRLLRTPAMEAFAFQGSRWHASLALSQPTTFTMPGVDQLGSITLTTVVMIASAGAESLPLSRLPYGLRPSLDRFAASGALPLAAGINVFIAGRAGDGGALGQLKRALGLDAEDLLLTGTVGEGVFTRALHAADASVPESGDANVSMTVKVPRMAPPLFRGLPAAARQSFDLTVDATTFTVQASAATPSAWSVAGSIDATAKLGDRSVTLRGALGIAGAGTGRTLAINVWADIPDAPLFGIGALTLQKVGMKLTTTGATSTLAVQAMVDVAGRQTTAEFAAVLNGTTVTEISASLIGSLPLEAAGLDASQVGSFSVANPIVGFMPATGEGFVGGLATWVPPGAGAAAFSVDAVAYARRSPTAGLALFLQLDSTATLSDVLGSAPGGFDLPIPRGILVASSIDLTTPTTLPSRAQAMLDAIAGGSRALSIKRGLALITSIPANRLPSGVSGPVVIGGAIGLSPPSLALTASVGTFTLPDEITTRLPLRSVAPRVFLRVSSAPALEVGVGMDLTLDDNHRPVTMAGELSGVLSAAGVSATLRGQLGSDWVDPLGLAGVTIKKDTGLAFAAVADGSVAITADGAADIGGLAFGLGGSIGVRFSTVIPTPQSFALRLAASDLGLIAPAQVAQVFLNNASRLAANLKTAGGTALPAEVRTALDVWKANAGSIDLPALLAQVIPDDEPARTLMTLKLEDAVLFVATPGAATQGFPALDDVGVQVKGTLVKKKNPADAKDAATDKVLASVDSYVTLKKGVQLRAMLADTTIGPLSLTGTSIDLGAGIPFVQSPAAAPRFRVSGAASLAGLEVAHVDVDIDHDTVHAAAGVNLGICRPTVVATPKVGSLVAIYSPHSRRFLRVIPSGPVVAEVVGDGAPTSLPTSYTQQQFRVLDGGYGLVLKAEGTERYLRMNSTVIEAPSLTSLPVDYVDQRFDVVLAGEGQVGIFNRTRKRFVRVNGAGGLDTSAERPDATLPPDWAWERFQIVQLSSGMACAAVQDLNLAGSFEGDIVGVASYDLKGQGRLAFPQVGSVQVPPLAGDFHFKTNGLSVDTGARFEGADFRFQARLKALNDWTVSGTAKANAWSTEVKLSDVAVARVTLKETAVALSASPSNAALSARGGFAVDVFPNGVWQRRVLDVPFDGAITVDDRAIALRLEDVPDPATAFTSRRNVDLRIPILKQ